MGSSFTQLALKGSAQLTATEQRFLLVGAEHLIKTHDGLAVSSTEKTTMGVTEMSLDVDVQATVWTTVAGERFLIQSMLISSNLTALFEVSDGVTIIFTARINDHEPFIYIFPDGGYLSLADNNNLALRNKSAVATVFSVWLMGYRVTAGGLFLR